MGDSRHILESSGVFQGIVLLQDLILYFSKVAFLGLTILRDIERPHARLFHG